MKNKSLLLLSMLAIASSSAFANVIVKGKLISHKLSTTAHVQANVTVTDIAIDQKKIDQFLHKAADFNSIFIRAKSNLSIDNQFDPWVVGVANKLHSYASSMIFNDSNENKTFVVYSGICHGENPIDTATLQIMTCNGDDSTYNLSPGGYVVLEQGVSFPYTFTQEGTYQAESYTNIRELAPIGATDTMFSSSDEGYIHVLEASK